jgi:hypothetical protein
VFAASWPTPTLDHAIGDAHSVNIMADNVLVFVRATENDCAQLQYQLIDALSMSITPPPVVANS